jgi:hypothetical protein
MQNTDKTRLVPLNLRKYSKQQLLHMQNTDNNKGKTKRERTEQIHIYNPFVQKKRHHKWHKNVATVQVPTLEE